MLQWSISKKKRMRTKQNAWWKNKAAKSWLMQATSARKSSVERPSRKASTFPSKDVETFGSDVPLGRPGQPEEIAPSYVFLASDDSSYMTGQIPHPNGGTVVNG